MQLGCHMIWAAFVRFRPLLRVRSVELLIDFDLSATPRRCFVRASHGRHNVEILGASFNPASWNIVK
jgi:hypothetical protein